MISRLKQHSDVSVSTNQNQGEIKEEQLNKEQQERKINANEIHLAQRKQPIEYPHGFGISMQEVSHKATEKCAEGIAKYPDCYESHCQDRLKKTNDFSETVYGTGNVGGAGGWSELQIRSSIYVLGCSSYLDTTDGNTKSMFLIRDFLRRFCKWKFLRWPIIVIVSVLLIFGFISYCIWLHDVSIVRQKYLQQHYQFNRHQIEEVNNTGDSVTDLIHNTSIITTTILTKTKHTNQNQKQTKLTILRPVNTSKQSPMTQKLAIEKNEFSDGKKNDDNYKLVDVDITTLATEEAALIPSNVVRFSLKDHNKLGVSIKDDERFVRLINGFYPVGLQESTTNNLAKVSPTIPAFTRSKLTTAMTATGTTGAIENGCYSTSLQMCRGVLDYDLTYNLTTITTAIEIEDFQKLIYSNCSARAVEFICASLEPECRPKHIGIILPCRRLCKAILEACSIIIANSDILTATFDCNRYPDSSDPHKCEDPTRWRGYCYNNEFECFDHTCIPYQWQCDNIKDCSDGEDENNCLICDQQDEFRCRSNEKCISESVRCDLKNDCFDGSDEENCENFGSGDESFFDEPLSIPFSRNFNYESFLPSNQKTENIYTYITASTEQSDTKSQIYDGKNLTVNLSTEEITKNVPVETPQGLVNFRDSKEIMMTSDSENKFKYSTAGTNHTSSKFLILTTPLQRATSMQDPVTTNSTINSSENCSDHQLRCVSGKCITVNQLCDKKMDCPDGADELMCVYKERRTTTTRFSNFEPTTTAKIIKKSIRTTIKRTTIKR